MDYKINSIVPIVNNIRVLLRENKEYECLNDLEKNLSDNDSFAKMSLKLGEWKRRNIDKNSKLKTLLKEDIENLQHYFSERNVLKTFTSSQYKKKSIFLEILGCCFGSLMIASGIYDEIHHSYFEMEGASTLLDIKPGFSASLYGLILLGCCSYLIYTKRIKI